MRLKGFAIRRERMLRGASLPVMAAGLLMASPALAQDAPPADDSAAAGDEIVVVGVRAALQDAQDRKRDALTVVDSITATDIGAFPDNSVASALQRVPGITVSRLQSTDDSTHPSGEPAGVLIRGLTFVRTEINGRDSFSADSYRGLNFNDISPELMSRVDAYKNQTADMIEGGIAGTVDLRTRLPLDEKGLVVAANAKATYGDRSDKWNGEFSVLVSKTFDTDIGRFGLMADYARSHLVTRTESVIMDKIRTYCSAGAVDAEGNGIVNPDGSVACTANPFGGTGWAYLPDGVRYSQVDYDRTREGIALAGQYESPTGDVRATVQFIKSSYDNAWLENVSHAKLEGTYYGTPAFNPVGSTILRTPTGNAGFTFGPDGMLRSAQLSQGYGSWRGSFGSEAEMIDTGSAVPGLPFVNYCGPGSACAVPDRNGLYFENEARNFDHRESTRDLSANIQWDVTDRFKLNFDAQWIKAKTTNDDILVATASAADYEYSVNEDGTPNIELLPGTNINYADGGLANPHNYWMPFIQAHLEDNDAEELALKADAEYDFDGNDWIDSLKVGVRYADRNQNVRYSTFNWTPIAAPWNCNGPGFNVDNSSAAPYPAGCGARPDFNGYGQGLFEPVSLGGGFYNGSVYDNGELVYLSRDALRDRDRLVEGLRGSNVSPPILPGWTPICDRAEATVGCFTPSEVMEVTEKTKAAYAMLGFGGDNAMLGGMNVRGNIGVRVVRTDIDSVGNVGFPQSSIFTPVLNRPCGTPLPPGDVVNPACFLTPEILAFANGAAVPNNLKADYTTVLPSFNVRFGIDDNNFIRFAYSRAMARPDFGLLRNFVAIQTPSFDASADSPNIVRDGAGNITGYNFTFRAESGFAGLKPILADQFDLTFEHYAGSTSFHADIFYKKLRNTVAYGEFERVFTNNGSEQTVLMRGPRNVKDGGELYGFETGFQTFFDFLPGLLSGLGAQANYTHVRQSGISNSNLVTQGALDGGGTGGFGAGLDVSGGRGVVMDSHRLAGISKHTFNLVGLYEKGPVAFRVAYNWRSRFLTNNLDCCIGLPVFQKSVGFLDASLRISPTPWLELSVEGQNLLNTTTVYQQQIFGDTPLTPGAKPVYRDANWGRVDRRFQFGARVKF
jgi:TonB-dependent receptor